MRTSTRTASGRCMPLGPAPVSLGLRAWHVPPRRPPCGPYPVDTLGRPIGAGAPTRGEARLLPLPVLRHAVLAGVGLVLVHHGHAVQPSDLLRPTSRRSIDDIKAILGHGSTRCRPWHRSIDESIDGIKPRLERRTRRSRCLSSYGLIIRLRFIAGLHMKGRKNRVIILINFFHFIVNIKVNIDVVMPRPYGHSHRRANAFVLKFTSTGLCDGNGGRRRHVHAQDLVFLISTSGATVSIINSYSVYMFGGGCPPRIPYQPLYLQNGKALLGRAC